MIEYLRTDGASLNISYTAPANTVSIVYSVYDLDNDQYIQYDQTNTVVSNVFTLTLNSDTTAYDRKLKIDIQGIKTNDSFTDEIYISLVRCLLIKNYTIPSNGKTILCKTNILSCAIRILPTLEKSNSCRQI
jgi:hypothetical protein